MSSSHFSRVNPRKDIGNKFGRLLKMVGSLIESNFSVRGIPHLVLSVLKTVSMIRDSTLTKFIYYNLFRRTPVYGAVVLATGGECTFQPNIIPYFVCPFFVNPVRSHFLLRTRIWR